MKCLPETSNRLVFAAAVVVATLADRADACAVCFGDPDSPMAKGAVAGVLVLMGIVGFVLAGMAGTSLFWVHRSRRLAGQGGTANESPLTSDR